MEVHVYVKPIIIDKKHEEQINEILALSQKKLRVRIIEDYNELTKMIKSKIKHIKICKSAWDKCEIAIHCGRECSFPSAYKYVPMGTYAKIRLGKDGKGRLIEIGRSDCTKSNYDYIILTDRAKEAIMREAGVTNYKLEYRVICEK